MNKNFCKKKQNKQNQNKQKKNPSCAVAVDVLWCTHSNTSGQRQYYEFDGVKKMEA